MVTVGIVHNLPLYETNNGTRDLFTRYTGMALGAICVTDSPSSSHFCSTSCIFKTLIIWVKCATNVLGVVFFNKINFFVKLAHIVL